LDNSPEGRRLWMEVMSQVLSDYGDSLTSKGQDPGKSTAYNEMSSFWGNVSGYFDSATEASSGIQDTEREQATVAAQEIAATKTNINSMADFNSAIKDIIASLSGYEHLSKEEKNSIAISAL
jgi:hypothetical protein